MPETILPEALCTLEEVQVYLKRPGASTDDEVFTRLINYATGQIENLTRRRLKLRTYTGATAIRFSGRGSSEITLGDYPIATVTKIEELDANGAVFRELNLTGWRASTKGVLELPNDYFAKGRLNHLLTGTVGITTTTAEWKALTGLALRWIQVMFQDFHSGIGRGVAVTIGGNSVTLIDQPMPKDIAMALRPFVKEL